MDEKMGTLLLGIFFMKNPIWAPDKPSTNNFVIDFDETFAIF
jgi:hypothetical protein